MSFQIVTDSSSNLPTPYLEKHHIPLVYFTYNFNGTEYACKDTETFDGETYYKAIKAGAKVSTSQVTPQQFIDVLTPILKAGDDVLFISMSSGISGSFNSANIAKNQLSEEFPARKIVLIDTLAASLGQGISVVRAIEMKEEGKSLEEIEAELYRIRPRVYQSVMLDELMYLRRTGRVSSSTAILGTVLGIRPLLKGSPEGTLVVTGRVKGHKAALRALADKYAEVVKDAENQFVGIAYTSSEADAIALGDMLKKIAPPKELLIVRYEPVTGSHVGPDTIALFYQGDDNAREL